MLNIQYKEDRYRIATAWEEIELQTAINILEVINNFPDNLKTLYKLSTEKDKEAEAEKVEKLLTDKENRKIIPALYGQIICLLSDIPGEVMKTWGELEIRAFYMEYIIDKVYGLMFFPIDYQVKRIASFEHIGVEYMLPVSRMVMGNEKTFAEITALEFAEAADLEIHSKQLQNGRIEVAANIVAILCRPEGEAYDETTSLERAETFLTLPMHIIWEVFFYTLELSTLLRQRSLICSMEETIKQGKQQSKAD